MLSRRGACAMDVRFGRHWDTWHRLRAEGKSPAEFLSTASDETLVELLAVGTEGTPVERNIIATELTNRISRLHKRISTHHDATDALVDANKAALNAADKADDAIRGENQAFRNESDKTSRYGGKDRKGGW